MCCRKMKGGEKNKSATGGFSIPLNNSKRNRSPFHKDAHIFGVIVPNAVGNIYGDTFQSFSINLEIVIEGRVM